MNIPDIYLFYGCISLLPLFFLYLLYRNLAWRRQWKQWFDGYYAARGRETGRKDVEQLITELSSSDRGLYARALAKYVRPDSSGVDLLLAALDMPYFRSRKGKYIFTNGETTGVFVKSVPKIHHFLFGALLEFGHYSPNALKTALQHPNLNVRSAAMFALGRSGDTSHAGLLLPFLDSTNLDEKASAIVALGQMRAINAFDKILSSLKDEDVYIRVSAINALGNLGDGRALPYLEDIARFDNAMIENERLTLSQMADWAIENIRHTNTRGMGLPGGTN